MRFSGCLRVLSNRHNSSRDIANDKAHRERVKYTLLAMSVSVSDNGHAVDAQGNPVLYKQEGGQTACELFGFRGCEATPSS